MSKDGPETQYRKSSVAFGSTLLAGSLITGPIAPLFALTGAAFIIGAGLRGVINKQAKKDYISENNQIQEKDSYTSFYPESPETALARSGSYEAVRLLRDLSNDRVNEKALETAEVIAKEYLDRLSQKRIDEIKKLIFLLIEKKV